MIIIILCFISIRQQEGERYVTMRPQRSTHAQTRTCSRAGGEGESVRCEMREEEKRGVMTNNLTRAEEEGGR